MPFIHKWVSVDLWYLYFHSSKLDLGVDVRFRCVSRKQLYGKTIKRWCLEYKMIDGTYEACLYRTCLSKQMQLSLSPTYTLGKNTNAFVLKIENFSFR